MRQVEVEQLDGVATFAGVAVGGALVALGIALFPPLAAAAFLTGR